jgi:hypothetical protein
LFESTYPHRQGQDCDRTKSVDRDARPDTDPQIHYGTIDSGNAVIKDGTKRDQPRKVVYGDGGGRSAGRILAGGLGINGHFIAEPLSQDRVMVVT